MKTEMSENCDVSTLVAKKRFSQKAFPSILLENIGFKYSLIYFMKVDRPISLKVAMHYITIEALLSFQTN